MNKFLKTGALAALSALLISCGADPEQELMQRAQELQQKILTIDTHTDTPMKLWYSQTDLTKDLPRSNVDFPKMKQGGLDVVAFAVFTSQRGRDDKFVDGAYERALQTFDKIDKVLADNSDIVGCATTPEEMYALKAQGKLVILKTVENSTIVDNDISRVHELYRRGARIFGICHSYNNGLSDSSSDAKGPEFGGLSKSGEEFVKEVNRLGGVIDVSHASDSTFYDVIRLSKTPIIASHSSVRAIAHHDRNFDDNMLYALKENGGTIQICILDRYVKDIPKNKEYDERRAALLKEYRATPGENATVRDSIRDLMDNLKTQYPDQLVTVKDYVDHIDYVVNKIGIDYVGIGTDFEGGGGVSDCMSAAQLTNITAELLRRGYSEEDIEKIWSKNFLRVFDKVIEYRDSVSCE